MNKNSKPWSLALWLALVSVFFACGLPAWAATGTWTSLAGGSWTNAANWSGGTIPGAIGDTANFNTLDLTADAIVTLDGARTNGNFVFADTTPDFNWFLNAGFGGPLTLNVAGSQPTVTVNNQAATLGLVIAGTNGFIKAGPGLLVLASNNTYTGGTLISAGTLRMGVTNAILAASTVTLGTTNTGSAPTTFQLGPSTITGGTNGVSPLVVSSNAPASVATLDNNPASVVVGITYGSITLQNHDLWITNSGTGIMQLSGQITGTGSVYVSNGSYGKRCRFVFSGNNFVGDLRIVTGGVQLFTGGGTTGDYVPNTADVYMSANTTLGLGGSDTIGALVGGDADVVNSLAAAVVKPNLSGNGTMTLTLGANNHNGVFAGQLADESSGHILAITKTGTGIQVVSNANTFTGTFILSGGTVAVGNDAALGTGIVNLNVAGGVICSADATAHTLANPITLSLDTIFGLPGTGNLLFNTAVNNGAAAKTLTVSNSVTEFSGGLTNSGAISKAGPGTLVLSGANTYAGTTTVSAGTLSLGASGSIANTASIALTTNAMLDVSQLFTPFTLGVNQTLSGNGVVTGNVSTATGAIVSPGNTVGTLSFSNNLSLGGASLNVDLTGTFTVGGGVNDLIQMAGGVLDVSGGVTVAISGQPANGSYTIIQGAGSIIGSAANFQATGARGNYAFDTTSVPGSVRMTVSGAAPGYPLVWQGNAGNKWDLLTTYNWTNSSGTPDLFYNSDAVTFNDTGLNTNVVLVGSLKPASVTVNSTSNYVFGGTGKITGTTSLTKSGAGTLTVTNANDFSGGVTVSGGTLATTVTSVQNSLGTGLASVGPGATLQLNNANTADATGPTITNIFTGTGLLKLNFAGGATARNTRLTNLFGFTGTLELTNTGATGDKLNVGTPTSSAPGAFVIVDSGSQLYCNTVTNTFASVSLMGTGNSETRGALRLGTTLNAPITLAGDASIGPESGTLLGNITSGASGTQTLTIGTTSSTGNATNYGIIGGGIGTIALTKAAAGTLVLANANTYAGNTVISAGTLQLGPVGSIASSPVISVASGATFNPAPAGTYTLASGRTLAGGGASAGVVVGNLTMSTGSILAPGGTNAFGTLAVTTNLTITGGTLNFELARVTTVGGGVNDLLQVGTNLTVSGTPTIIVSGYPTNGSYTIITNVSGTQSGTAAFALVNQTRANVTLDTSSNKRVVVTATTNPPVTLVWRGDGLNNVWDNAITANWVSNGVAGQFFYPADNVIFDDTGSNTPPINLIAGLQPTSVQVTNSSGTYAFGGTGTIQGTAALTKQGAGTLLITNSQPFTGLTTISGGTLQVGNGGTTGALSGNGPITNNGTLTYNQGSNTTLVTIANVISGSGTINFIGSPTATIQGQYSLSAVNSGFTGVINLSNARLQNVTDATRLGSPSMINVPAGSGLFLSTASTFTQPLSIAGQGWLENSAPGYLGALRLSGSTIYAGPITLTGNARIAGNGVSGTVSGPISGAYELELANTLAAGSSTFTMSTMNTTASTRLSSFGLGLAVVLGNSSGLSTGPLTLGTNTTLRLNGNNASFATLTGTTTSTNANNHASLPATFTVGGNNANIAFPGLFINGAAAALNLTKVGAGNLTLSAANTYSGSTTISNGTLTLDATGNLANSSPINVAPGALFDIAASTFTLGAGKVLSAGRSSGFATDINGALTSGGTLQPAGNGAAGTLTVNGALSLTGGVLNLDLTNTPTAGAGVNDLISVNGPLNLSGTTTITANWVGGKVGAGTYTLITASSTPPGAASFFTLGSGLISGGRATYALDDSTPGMIKLIVTGVPAQLVWTNAISSVWDNGTTANWLNAGVLDTFYAGDFTIFDDRPTSDQSINVVEPVTTAGMTFSNSVRAYTFTDGGAGQITSTTLSKPGAGSVTIGTPFEVSGTMNLGGGSLVLAPKPGKSHLISGPISGPGALVKADNGQLFLSGANTGFNGPVTLAQGELIAQHNNALGVNPLTIGNALTGPADTNLLTIDAGITVTNSLVVETNALDATIGGSGAVGAAASLTKKGPGILKVANTNTFTGPTIVEAGTLQLDLLNAPALASATTVTLGTTNTGSNSITFKIGQSSVAKTVVETSPIIVSSNAPNATVYLDNNAASTTVGVLGGTVTMQNHDLWITNSTAVIWQIDGQLTGAGSVYVATGTYGRRVRFNYNGDNFVGNVYVLNGGIQTGNGVANSTSDAIPNNSDVFMSAGTTLGLGASDTLGALNGGGQDFVNGLVSAIVKPNISGGGVQTLTLGNNNHDGTYDGDMDNEGSTHVLRLTKIGTGKQTLNGNCTLTGQTLVNAGTLLVNGNYSSTNITVASSAVVGGIGSLSSVVVIQAGGTLSPGTNLGTLTINSDLLLGGNLFMEVDKSLSPSNDFVYVGGVLANSGTGTLTVTNLNPGAPLALGDKFTLFSQALLNGGALTIQPMPGPGLAWTNNLAFDGSIGVITGIASNPTNITVVISGGNLNLSWPADHLGWRLQAQTNSLSVGIGTNWGTWPGSTLTNAVSVPIDPANPTVFFRLAYP